MVTVLTANTEAQPPLWCPREVIVPLFCLEGQAGRAGVHPGPLRDRSTQQSLWQPSCPSPVVNGQLFLYSGIFFQNKFKKKKTLLECIQAF